MNYWIKSVLDEDGEPDKEVVIVDENDVAVARGGLRVDYFGAAEAGHELQCTVRFVGMAVG